MSSSEWTQRQPDVGGNRHYDYISVERHEAAKSTLEKKESWSELQTDEIVVLRSRAKEVHLCPDVVDHADRLELIRCLFIHCENRDYWMNKAQELERELRANVQTK